MVHVCVCVFCAWPHRPCGLLKPSYVENLKKMNRLQWSFRIFSHQCQAKVTGDNLGKCGVPRHEIFRFYVFFCYVSLSTVLFCSSHRLWKISSKWAGYRDIFLFFSHQRSAKVIIKATILENGGRTSTCTFFFLIVTWAYRSCRFFSHRLWKAVQKARDTVKFPAFCLRARGKG